MALPKAPGKTPPRIIRDVYYYDPQNPPSSGFNLMIDTPPIYQSQTCPEILSSRACDHQYATKRDQSVFIQGPDNQPGPDTLYKVSSICMKCRIHLDLIVRYGKKDTQTKPGHLHHLVYIPGKGQEAPDESSTWPKGQQTEAYTYECSYPTCSAVVSIKFTAPILTPDMVAFLLDTRLLQQRTDEALNAFRDRLEGLPHPFPITVLDHLRMYIDNALQDKYRGKTISFMNKKFLACFGVGGKPCKELLEFLMFNPKDDGSWDPPPSNTTDHPPYHEPLNIFYDNVVNELTVLIKQRPQQEKQTLTSDIPIPEPSLAEIQDSLGALNYTKASPLLSHNMRRPPYYEDLGTLQDMSSEAIVEAYYQQIRTDPERARYYLRCLREIGRWRETTDAAVVNMAVAKEYSEDKFADDDIPNAYKFFQLDYRDSSLTDEYILGAFDARIRDTADEQDTRKQLLRIGDHRGSEKIRAAAKDRVSNAEQALVYLGADTSTPDDFIISMYAAKISDSPANKEIAQRAIALIAEQRQSDALNLFLRTGELEATEMDVGEAYRLLQIPDRTVDDAAILAAYSVCESEAPADQIEIYKKALHVIATSKNSLIINSAIASHAPQANRVPSEWPVGLQNIGNTCYLNSLLQFYFSIKPFRDMILNVEGFKMPLDDPRILENTRQVGSRKISKKEIERSQRFVTELQTLFRDMITSPNASVKPEQELARLTLISSTNEAAIRRKSIISSTRPGTLGDINGRPIMGPLGPPADPTTEEGPNASGDQAQEPDSSVKEIAATKGCPTSDADSEATLVSEAARTETGKSPNAGGKENLPPTEGKVVTDSAVSNEPKSEGLQPASNTEPFIGPIGPPNRPPPVPPRPTPDSRKIALEEVELGAQQDVTEVINNLFFQTQCAIKPTEVDPTGEERNMIKDIFYGKTKSYIETDGETRSKDEFWCDIKVDVASGARDIYSAIDGAFDRQIVDVGGKKGRQHGTIYKLPPVVQIQVQRAQFDQVKKTSFKSTHHLELKDTIYFDRYMDTSDQDIKRRREESWGWKEEFRVLEARKAELTRKEQNDGNDIPNVFQTAKGALEELKAMEDNMEIGDDAVHIDPDAITGLDTLTEVAREEIARIEARQKDLRTMIETQFTDLRLLPYRLQAVFVHHGSVAFGHYYIYIYDFEKDVWRKYNDTNVTEVHDLAEIFEHRDEQNPPTPYFLVYVFDRKRDILVDPVCREIAEPEPHPAESTPTDGAMDTTPDKPTEDVQMEDPPTYRESMADKAGTNIRDSTTSHSPSSGHEKSRIRYDAVGGRDGNEIGTNDSEKIQW
ncbi:ubiquitin-specific protease ubp2 [Arachnomyces sp. PD_36]|nr:ubiquitin-specific protease ubp2 [Arachnomyces sp. PD_36]